MNSGLFNLLIFVIFFLIILVVAGVLFVPIKNENACVKYCTGEGFKGGFCAKVSLDSPKIREIETRENANLTDGQCLWNPVALDMITYPRCFCRN